MRLGIDIRELERDKRTGIGRVLRNLVAHVVQRRPEHRLVLYGNQGTDVDWVPPGVEVAVLREGLTLWWDQVTLPRRARRDGLDVFLSPYMKGPIAVDCPLVVTIHDLIDFVFPSYRSPVGVLAKAMARRVGRRADLIFTVSEHARGDIERVLGLPRNKIRVLPNGVDEALQPPADPAAAAATVARYGIAAPYLLYLGNFKPHKNVQALIRAYAALDAALRDRVVLILGGRRDAHVAGLESLAAELGVAARTRFIGGVDDADMAALLGSAEVFVFPSLYEGFGLPPLEAMACGTAVVASDRTSIPEVVGDAGWLVDPEDPAALAAALTRLLADEDERRRLAARGRVRAAAFCADDLCARQLEALEGVAAG